MYMVRKNNYYKKQKNSTVYTPDVVAEKICSILSEVIDEGIIFDPCVGSGRLLKPWENINYETIGFDIHTEQGYDNAIENNYITLSNENNELGFTPSLVIINPPFNSNDEMRKYSKEMGYGSRPLMPELFLAKTIELFGPDTPIVLFTPYGLRLNNSKLGRRQKKFLNGTFPEIKSIISLPRDVYDDVTFHSEILIFNIDGIKPHYFIDFEQGDENGNNR